MTDASLSGLMAGMVSERPSTPPEDSQHPSVPPPVQKPSSDSDDEEERISVEPGSRSPWLPPPSTRSVEAESVRKPTETPLSAQSAAATSENGTKNIGVPSRPPTDARKSSQSIRPSRLSVDGSRKSRISMLRETILSALPSIPMSRISSSGPLGALGLVLVAIFGLGVWMWTTGRVPHSIASVLHIKNAATASLVPAPVPSVEAPVNESPFPTLKRGRAPMAGGVLYIPTSFTAKDDGSFDLVIHFHGNTDLTIESYETVQLDAVVAVLNLGAGSGHYEDRFASPAALAEVLARTTDALEQRGLPHAHLKRLALVSWSAGYGAVIKILDHPQDADRVDAVLMLDGLHVSYREGTHDVEEATIAGVERFAERAKKGERLFLVTHSDIVPNGYLGVHETVDFILKKLGVERHAASGTTTLPKMASMEGVLPKDELKPLTLTSEAHEGGLIIRGYGGNDSATHIAHLVQMSELALPSLVARWQ